MLLWRNKLVLPRRCFSMMNRIYNWHFLARKESMRQRTTCQSVVESPTVDSMTGGGKIAASRDVAEKTSERQGGDGLWDYPNNEGTPRPLSSSSNSGRYPQWWVYLLCQ
ncbi:hypothetical protein ABBQ32_008820 [Trebouxia sp. C0010 RCD-2024]